MRKNHIPTALLVGALGVLGAAGGCSSTTQNTPPTATSEQPAARLESDLKVDAVSTISVSSNVFTGRVLSETSDGLRPFLPTKNYYVQVGSNTKGTAPARTLVAVVTTDAENPDKTIPAAGLEAGKAYTFFASADDTIQGYVVTPPRGIDPAVDEHTPSLRARTLPTNKIVTDKGIGQPVPASHSVNAAPPAPATTTSMAPSTTPTVTTSTPQEQR